MKYIYTLLFFLLSFGIFAQTQKTLITKRTATWCPFCGSWGWELAKAIEEKDNPNGIVIRAHYSGDLVSEASLAITNNFGGIYQPEFYVNEEKIAVGGSTWMTKVDEFDAVIDENADELPEVSFFANSSVSGNTISLDATVNALKNMEGEYYFGAYLLEDYVVNYQSSIGNDAVHNNVLRDAFTSNVFGEEFGNATVEEGFSKKFELSVNPEGGDVNNRKFKILLILWKKDGEKYSVVNIDFFEAGQSTNVEEIKAINQFNIYTIGEQLIIDTKETMDYMDTTIEIFDSTGKRIQSQRLNNQQKSVILLNSSMVKGIYFYQILQNNRLLQSGKFSY